MTDETLHGANPIIETLLARRRRVHEIYTVQGRQSDRADRIAVLAKERFVPIVEKPAAWFKDRFPDRQDQGVAAKAAPYPYADLGKMLGALDRPALLVALDQVQDPRNLGAIVRSCVAMGAQGVIIHKDRSAHVTPAVLKASAGMTEHIDIARVTNLVRALETTRAAGIWNIGLEGSSDRCIQDEDLTVDTLLVMGSEGKGLRRLTSQRCDSLVSIPIDDRCQSLNVSVAAALALAEARRQRTVSR